MIPEERIYFEQQEKAKAEQQKEDPWWNLLQAARYAATQYDKWHKEQQAKHAKLEERQQDR